MNNNFQNNYINLWKIPKNLHNILETHDSTIITRFIPEQCGYLHLKHTKDCFLNFVLTKKFNGLMILRFNDINPFKENFENEKSILKDINKLGLYADKITHISDYFSLLIKYVDYLIDNNLAYVDDSNQEVISESRDKLLETMNRINSIEKNKQIWKEMQNGEKREFCIRIKIDMKHKNPACRDPIIYRFLKKGNQLNNSLENKFKIFPTYDFCCPIIDFLEGITHVFNADSTSKNEQYNEILNILNLKKPLLFNYGKINLKNIDNRNFKKFNDKKIIDNWEDPRLLTIKGLFNRGLHVDPLRQFVSKFGFYKNGTNMDIDILWNLNKKYIDKIATRYIVLPKDNILKFNIIKNKHLIKNKEIQKFKKNNDLGTRLISFDNELYLNKIETINFFDGEEITLINWTNAFVFNNNLKLNLKGNFKMSDKKILWISQNNNVNVKIITYENLYDNPKINYYLGEIAMINLKKGDYVQLIKMNYYMCLDINFELNEVFLIEIPK